MINTKNYKFKKKELSELGEKNTSIKKIHQLKKYNIIFESEDDMLSKNNVYIMILEDGRFYIGQSGTLLCSRLGAWVNDAFNKCEETRTLSMDIVRDELIENRKIIIRILQNGFKNKKERRRMETYFINKLDSPKMFNALKPKYRRIS